MKQQVANYKRLERDLLKQVDQCNKYKLQIQRTLQELRRQYEQGYIDGRTHKQQVHKYLQGKEPHHWFNHYDNHINKCNQHLSYYRGKIEEASAYFETKRNTFSKWLMLAAVLFLILGGMTYLDVDIPLTGFVTQDSGLGEIIHEDGYNREGSRWMDIRGDHVYERCLKVDVIGQFSGMNMRGKIMSASDEKILQLKLYTHDMQADTPGEVLGSCRVTNYEELWKTCSINTGKQKQGSYWLCAGTSSGKPEQTYYSLAYQVGDDKETALWTGQNWQRLNRASYTLKAQFKR